MNKPVAILFLITFFFLTGQNVTSQNKYIPPDPYTDWDGVSHWSEYLILAPNYLGPNALPVPQVKDGLVPSGLNWQGTYNYYYGEGDITHDFETRLLIPMANGRVAILAEYTPFEFYQVDSITSRSRRSFSGDQAEGYALGDVYFGTQIQLIKSHPWLPDLSFSMSCRTASGTGRENARHTDTPGYYLDLSGGRSFPLPGNYLQSLRIYGMLGFYVWQTYLDNYPQNDALLYGGGVNLISRDFTLEQTLRGYSGYMNNGDHPLVSESTLGIRAGDAQVIMTFEKGLRDFPFTGLKMGIRLKPL